MTCVLILAAWVAVSLGIGVCIGRMIHFGSGE